MFWSLSSLHPGNLTVRYPKQRLLMAIGVAANGNGYRMETWLAILILFLAGCGLALILILIGKTRLMREAREVVKERIIDKTVLTLRSRVRSFLP
jgi:hypothetical protein